MKTLSPLSKYRLHVKETPGHNHNAEPIPASQALTLPDGVSISRTALVCPRQLTINEWKALGRALGQLEGSVQWWIGDWWHYGAHAYGERKSVATAKGTFGRAAFGTLMNYGYVAGRVETSRRREVLSFSHHVEVAKLEPKEQERWLAVAAQDKLSVNQLRIKMFDDEHSGGKFTEDEIIRADLTRLVKAAQVSKWLTLTLPWERTDLEHYLERNCHLRPGLVALAKEFEKAATFWSNTAQFVRRIESNVRAKAPQPEIRGAATQSDKSHRRESNGLEMESCG